MPGPVRLWLSSYWDRGHLSQPTGHDRHSSAGILLHDMHNAIRVTLLLALAEYLSVAECQHPNIG